MRELLLVIVAIAILFVAGTAAVESTFQSSGDRFDVEGETWSPDAGNVTQLEDSGLDVEYDTRVDVRDADGKEMISGSDYQWHSTNGTVEAIDDGRLANESNATISYGYSAPSESQEGIITIWTSIGTAIPGLLILLMVVIVLLAWARFASL